MTQYNILITSDVVCPWCYIGHTRLSKAISTHKTKFPDDTFSLKYIPYYLNPAAQVTDPNLPAFPVPSMNKREYYAQKFGPQQGKAIEARLIHAAAQDGLTFSFGGNTGPSRNAHRLVFYAQSHGGETAQNDVMLGLWRRYYEREVDITLLDVLVEVGVEAGLGSAEEVKEYLVSGRDAAKVDQLAEEQRREGISGVPNYLIQDQWEVSGAQEPKVFERLFLKWKEWEKDKGTVSTEFAKADEKGSGACL